MRGLIYTIHCVATQRSAARHLWADLPHPDLASIAFIHQRGRSTRVFCCAQKGLIPNRRQIIVNTPPICPTTTRTTSPRICNTRQTYRGRESGRASKGDKLGSAVHAKHRKGSAGTDPRTNKATILLMDRRKSMRPAMKRKTETKMGMCSAVSTARAGVGTGSAYSCGASRCVAAISESSPCSCGASAAERTMARIRTKLRNQSTLILMADAKGLNGTYP